MIVEPVDVKSGDKVLITLQIEKFDSIQEAVSFYNTKLEGSDEAGQGDAAVLGLINAQHKAKTANAKRVELTKEVNPISALKARIKSDPAAKARLQALLAEFGIGGELAGAAQ